MLILLPPPGKGGLVRGGLNSYSATATQPFPVIMDNPFAQARVPGLFRRLAALAYDLILVFGMLLLAATLVIIPLSALSGTEILLRGWPRHLFQLYLLVVAGGFLVYFWVHGGQTLGMRAWRFRLLRDDGQPLSLGDAARRLLWASLVPAPLGLLWIPFDQEGLAPHDRLSRTRPVLLKNLPRAAPRP